jgi:hypothetical protein
LLLQATSAVLIQVRFTCDINTKFLVSTFFIQELALVWTSISTGKVLPALFTKAIKPFTIFTAGAVITQDLPGSGSGIWTPLNRASNRLEVAPFRDHYRYQHYYRLLQPCHLYNHPAFNRLQVWDLATDLNSTRTMRWRHGNCQQNVRRRCKSLVCNCL